MMSSLPTLVALTEEAERALGGHAEVRLMRFPFRVGRESRSRSAGESEQQRHGVELPLNDLCLIESRSAALLHISREHFAIECVDNLFFLVDRGSTCGTIVAGKHVGGDRTGGRTPLQQGDLVVVGTARSPYVFRFELKTAFHSGRDAERGRVVDRDRATDAHP